MWSRGTVGSETPIIGTIGQTSVYKSATTDAVGAATTEMRGPSWRHLASIEGNIADSSDRVISAESA